MTESGNVYDTQVQLDGDIQSLFQASIGFEGEDVLERFAAYWKGEVRNGIRTNGLRHISTRYVTVHLPSLVEEEGQTSRTNRRLITGEFEDPNPREAVLGSISEVRRVYIRGFLVALSHFLFFVIQRRSY